MIRNIFFTKKIFIFLFVLISVSLLILAVVNVFNKETPPITPKNIFYTSINKTRAADIQNLKNLLAREVLPDGTVKLSLRASVGSRPNTILLKNDVTIYEQSIVPPAENKNGYTLSNYKKLYGEPEKEIAGSAFYGWHIHHYIYSNRGFTVVGNPNTDEIYEIQRYLPSDVATYITAYGSDIAPDAKPETEEFDATQDKLMAFKETLPYYGTTIFIRYDKSTDNVTAYLQNTPASQEEFATYLKKYGVERTMITNLEVITQ